MPQASDELRAEFADDSAAWEVLKKNFTSPRFIITPKIHNYKPTAKEWRAIQYLCDEWDWGLDSFGGDS